MPEFICLKWNSHTNNLLSCFNNFLSNETLVDVTLACDGLSLKAHKIVLSACSPFFQSLFLENPCLHPTVILKDIKYWELQAIIEFMYNGEVSVPKDQLPSFVKTAKTLKVKLLGEMSFETTETIEYENQSSDILLRQSYMKTEPPVPEQTVSAFSDSRISEPESKAIDSDIEEIPVEKEISVIRSTVPLKTHNTNAPDKSLIDPLIVPNTDKSVNFNCSTSREETLTTTDLSNPQLSIQSNMEVPETSTANSSSLFPVTSAQVSSHALPAIQSNMEVPETSTANSSSLFPVTSAQVSSHALPVANKQLKKPPVKKKNLEKTMNSLTLEKSPDKTNVMTVENSSIYERELQVPLRKRNLSNSTDSLTMKIKSPDNSNDVLTEENSSKRKRDSDVNAENKKNAFKKVKVKIFNERLYIESLPMDDNKMKKTTDTTDKEKAAKLKGKNDKTKCRVSKKLSNDNAVNESEASANEYTYIGPSLSVLTHKFNACRAECYSMFIGDLMDIVFSSDTLANNVLKGTATSEKSVLDPKVIHDIQVYVTNKFGVSEKIVRNAIRQKLSVCHKALKKLSNTVTSVK